MDKFDVMDVNLKQREKIDFLESRIEMLKSQVLYVVEMLRWVIARNTLMLSVSSLMSGKPSNVVRSKSHGVVVSMSMRLRVLL